MQPNYFERKLLLSKAPLAKNDAKIIVKRIWYMTIRLLKLAVCSKGNFTQK